MIGGCYSQVSIHRQAHAELNTTVEELEKQNLDIMTELFDCKVEDLKFTRYSELVG